MCYHNTAVKLCFFNPKSLCFIDLGEITAKELNIFDENKATCNRPDVLVEPEPQPEQCQNVGTAIEALVSTLDE